MDKDKFAAILPILIGGLTNKIIEETKTEEDDVLKELYNSRLYAAIEDEATKFWTLSVPKLYELYQSETEKGEFEYPFE